MRFDENGRSLAYSEDEHDEALALDEVLDDTGCDEDMDDEFDEPEGTPFEENGIQGEEYKCSEGPYIVRGAEANYCRASWRGWTCTLTKGHEGDHAAHGSDATSPYAVWEPDCGLDHDIVSRIDAGCGCPGGDEDGFDGPEPECAECRGGCDGCGESEYDAAALGTGVKIIVVRQS